MENEYIVVQDESQKYTELNKEYVEWFDFLLDKGIFILLFLLVFYWNNNIKPTLSRMTDRIQLNKEVDQTILGILKEIQILTQADRVVYGQFHNGSYWTSGLSRIKFSAYLECKNLGISSAKEKVKNVEASLLYTEIELMKNSPNGFIFIDINHKDILEGCKLHLYSIGIEACYEFLVTWKEEIYGIIAIQYINRENYKNLKEEDYLKLTRLTSNIGFMIEKIKQKHDKSLLNVLKNKIFK